MDETIKFFTDTATLAIFDNEMLKARIKDNCDWWCGDFSSLEEVIEGKVSLVALGGDGVFSVRATDGDLNSIEKDYAKMVVSLGFEVSSSNVFIGKGECLPGEDFETSPENLEEGEGGFISIEPGKYNIAVYLIDWFESPDYWNPDYETPDNAPADIVLVIRKREFNFPGIKGEPRLISDEDNFLFESSTRKIGPEPGMILETKVWKNPKGLTLKECGPLDYKPVLTELDEIQWKDKIKIRVKSVDHENETMEVEYIDTVNS